MSPREPSFLRQHGAFLLLLALTAPLRFAYLGALPNPAGDEGNWAWMALRLSRGLPAGLDADASFVSLAFARLLSLSLRALGPSFFALRLVPATALVLALCAAYALFARLGYRASGLAACALLAVHPWTLAWGRTVSVPYALAFACGLVGTLCAGYGLGTKRVLPLAAGLWALLLGAQFSPLAAVPFAACAWWSLEPPRRWALRHPGAWAALLAGALFTAPMVLAASRIARSAPARQRLAHPLFELASYLHSLTTGLAGEATVRHFTHSALPWWPAWLTALPVLLAAGLASRREVRAVSPFPGLASKYLLASLVLVGLLLAPGRTWHLERIDTDRYLFATLPGLALCVGDLVAAYRGGALRRWCALALVLLFGTVGAATARCVGAPIAGGGPDGALSSYAGGGPYRGWLSTREREAVVVLLRDAALASLGDARGAQVLVADRAFHPFHFAAAGTALRGWDVNLGPAPREPTGRVFFVLWAPAVLRAPGVPEDALRFDAALRARMLGGAYRGARLVREIAQPNGFPLAQLWRAEAADAP